jgi:hypothetical protein
MHWKKQAARQSSSSSIIGKMYDPNSIILDHQSSSMEQMEDFNNDPHPLTQSIPPQDPNHHQELLSSSVILSAKSDVFLCFRGRDTGSNFTAHLFEALETRGIWSIGYNPNQKPSLLSAYFHSQIFQFKMIMQRSF